MGKAVHENGKGLQEASMVAFKYTPLPISSMGSQSMSENEICQPMTGCDHYEVKEKTALGGMSRSRRKVAFKYTPLSVIGRMFW